MTGIIVFVVCAIAISVWIGVKRDRERIQKLDEIERVTTDTNAKVSRLQ